MLMPKLTNPVDCAIWYATWFFQYFGKYCKFWVRLTLNLLVYYLPPVNGDDKISLSSHFLMALTINLTFLKTYWNIFDSQYELITQQGTFIFPRWNLWPSNEFSSWRNGEFAVIFSATTFVSWITLWNEIYFESSFSFLCTSRLWIFYYFFCFRKGFSTIFASVWMYITDWLFCNYSHGMAGSMQCFICESSLYGFSFCTSATCFSLHILIGYLTLWHM